MSEKIKDFFQKGDYENVLKETTFSDDAEDLLYRVLSFEALCKYKDALQEYYKSRNLVENWDLISSCKALMFLLVYFRKDEELKRELEYFRDFPYINQETEEFMQNLDNYVIHLKQYFNDSNKNPTQGFEDIRDALFSDSNDEKLYAIKKIYDLKTQGISCLSIVSDYLKSTTNFNTYYALLLGYAILANLPDKILFRKQDKYYSIIPEEYNSYLKELTLKLNEKISYMNMTEKNISIVRYISILVKPTFIYMLPDKIANEDLDSLLAALVIHGSTLYCADITSDDYLKSLVFTDAKVKKFKEVIDIVQNEF